ncbi:PLP-dependent aminotransferase family protein [Collimonas pratensis]|uniref:Alanine-glyoxylate amino-transferase family protein n=1 Tax=Collimonas pratensis TaxID=279113 RepID=A0A127PY16_9BURK|nr:PLP-dependent aminotransferase family protein [Collimonas pratensis]AMP02688.1 alanine-glyoxylate amino-transferase family protein [Collimonas pratensis]
MSLRSQISARYSAFDYSSTKHTINFGYGLPDPDTFRHLAAVDAMSEAGGVSLADILQYTDSQGLPELRQRLAARSGVASDQVMITSGASQALQLIADTLLDAGDVVLTEDPSYLGALRIFSIAGATVIQLGMDGEGVSLSELADALARYPKIKLYYTTPAFHNPSGQCISKARIDEVQRLLDLHGVPIVQDLVYSELPYEHGFQPALFGADTVISVRSFSKIAWPGLRVGWICAAPAMIARLALLKCDGGVSAVVSNIAVALLATDTLAGHIAYLRKHYRQKRDHMQSLLQDCTFCESTYTLPQGGFSFWVKLAPDLDPAVFLEGLRQEHGVQLAPGLLYGPRSSQFVRLCFSYMPVAKLEGGIARIEAACKDSRKQHPSGRSIAAPVVSALEA